MLHVMVITDHSQALSTWHLKLKMHTHTHTHTHRIFEVSQIVHLRKSVVVGGICLSVFNMIGRIIQKSYYYYYYLKCYLPLFDISVVWVLPHNFRNSTLFTAVCKKRKKNSPSTRCVSIANLLRKDVDIFSKTSTSSKQRSCANLWLSLYINLYKVFQGLDSLSQYFVYTECFPAILFLFCLVCSVLFLCICAVSVPCFVLTFVTGTCAVIPAR